MAPRKLVIASTLLVCWLGASTVAMYWFVFSDYGEFDPEQQWLGWQPPHDLGAKLSVANDASEITLVHVRDPACSCDGYVMDHIDTLQYTNPSADQTAVNYQEIDRAALEQSGFLVPATPMAMVFYGDQLAYAGPFASGPFCAADDSLIHDLLQRQTQLAGTFLNGLIKACRCV